MKRKITIPKHITDTKDFYQQLLILKKFFIEEIEWLIPIFQFPSNSELKLYRCKSTIEIKDLFYEKAIKETDNFYNLAVKKGFIIMVEFNSSDNIALLDKIGISRSTVFALFADEAELLTPSETKILNVVSIQEIVGRNLN